MFSLISMAFAKQGPEKIIGLPAISRRNETEPQEKTSTPKATTILVGAMSALVFTP
jgi:hypothetical protein